ncbi:hypothetical protein OHD16_06630 [Sphingobacterium sp. ML3W]|uniref:hypothetical protein n=1 Tax=Sphingobacterium sp. ML3W TaxID=1538644 RepID=UPI00249A164F|nr:hypothetical protein [Sphingobacterium sp. ML3W]WFA79644.1 hypothetical protein OGI71_26870 [Sphingobacterium sp. ML3W]
MKIFTKKRKLKIGKDIIVKFGKYSGNSFLNVPLDYADWISCRGCHDFKLAWTYHRRLLKHADFRYGTSLDGRFLEHKQKDGSYVFYVTEPDTRIRIYYIVDSEGNFVRDLKTIGSMSAKQGAIDETFTNWVTLSPSGQKIRGKMIVSPYYEHFEWDTYQVSM